MGDEDKFTNNNIVHVCVLGKTFLSTIRSREHTNAGSTVSAYIIGIIIASLYTHPRTCFNKR